MRSILCRQISGESNRVREGSEKALNLAIEEMERRQMRLQHAHDRERVEEVSLEWRVGPSQMRDELSL